jgi:uncharacterized protein (DUF2126 family)/transglutaminase-like putative cysteine protease
MSVRVSIEHRTEYRFDRPVELGPHEVRLRPAPHATTPIEAYSLTVQPGDHALNWQQDAFSNHVARVSFPRGTTATELAFEVGVVAELAPSNPFDFHLAPDAETWPPRYDEATRRALAPFFGQEPDAAGTPRLYERFTVAGRRTEDTPAFLVALNAALCDEIAYTTREEEGVQTPEQTLALARGSCRDSAWLLVTLLRGLGAAARFTSGYLVQLEPGGAGPDSDSVDLHAWAEVFVPGAGWIGLDPTSGLLTAEGHIPLASAADPAEAAPVIGSHSEGLGTLTHTMAVARVGQDPDPERPYAEETWQQILAVGDVVDAALERGDVRLTMGGEPTYVARAQLERPEWQVEALGGDKHELAVALAGTLAADFAPDPLIMHTQGKWYPGEPLPRWQIGIYWRTDARPLWPATELLDTPASPGTFTAADAHRLAAAITAALGLEPDSDLIPAHDPVIDAVGHVLPLHRDAGDAHWRSSRWYVEDDHIEVLPGDGPIGARLPLSQLTLDPDDPEIPPLPPTALCVDERDGHLHVYLPPLSEFAHAAELLDLLQTVALATATTLVLEGYGPPHDDRLDHFVITPDPGVIEINIHPSAGWPELVYRAETIAREADALGLAAEKFDMSGRHLGTGGGSHLTLGGTSLSDSPLLRRPQLLRSMLTYWQHHPSLSYLFSGQFVGPTSQAPRVDEARHESLYELEIAFDEMDRLSTFGPAPLDQVDSLLRNLLCDLTGNTHRAEFCIDKLHNPASPSGRLGVLELRGFEMPPHPRMSLMQALLVRALVARLWSEPYGGRLIRWGNRLHDDYMLPWFLERDLALVLDDLRRHGFAFADEWFEPFTAFRFPRVGTITRAGVRLELREAIEPWNVLGEQAASGGTARFVDSSVQRLQLRVDGYVEGRHAVLCNGCTVPLSDTDTAGTAIAGVRFRASAPPSALHPTIGVQAPLTFELVDLIAGRSLGGCRYHVADPGGREYERLPVNAAEASARRRARFETLGHTSGEIQVVPAHRSADYPRTLDLRAAGYRRERVPVSGQ